MKVKQLIALLQEENPNAVVLLSRDPEGNGFAEADLSFGVGWWSAEEQEYQDGTADRLDGDVAALTLWPMR